ncbi:MAG TPA: STAS domain-containing protein [Vicinamibacterales bacterium]|nr:STAS domain-containing protein [Vicinamibacterales bacterium]
MQIEVASDNGTTIVRPTGHRLDIEVAAEFRGILLSLIEQGHRQLIVDLNEVSFIDSSGLGALVSALKTLKRSNGAGDVRLARVQAPVVSLLEIIRLNRVFTSYDSVEQAVQSYQRVMTGADDHVDRSQPH